MQQCFQKWSATVASDISVCGKGLSDTIPPPAQIPGPSGRSVSDVVLHKTNLSVLEISYNEKKHLISLSITWTLSDASAAVNF